LGDQINADAAYLKSYGDALVDQVGRVRNLITNKVTCDHTDEPLTFFKNFGKRLANLELKDIATTPGVQRTPIVPDRSLRESTMEWIWERTGNFVHNTQEAIEGFQAQVMALYNSGAPIAGVEQRLVQTYQRYQGVQAMIAKR
jgi:hypothetical protein